MPKIKLLMVFLCLITFLLSAMYSASLTGTVYDEGINPIKGAEVKLEKEGILYSQFITQDNGTYSFVMPSGKYRISASMNKGNTSLQTSAYLNVSENDSMHIDLILIQELGINIPEIISVQEEGDFPAVVEPPTASTDFLLLGFISGLIIIAMAISYIIWKRQADEMKSEIEKIKMKKEEPPLGRFLTDEEKVYQIILKNKEIPQKHIVIETEFSKAKVTLILKKLEKLGKIKRTSTGREKIIKIVE